MKYLEIVLAGIGLAYFALFGNLSNHSTHNIYYDNIQYTDNVEFLGTEGLDIHYIGELSYPGDYYELTFDVVNDSPYDVEVVKCFYQESDSYIEYQLSYDDGSDILLGDVLKKGEKRHLKYRVLYKDYIESDSYEFDASFNIRYEQV